MLKHNLMFSVVNHKSFRITLTFMTLISSIKLRPNSADTQFTVNEYKKQNN